MLRMMLKLLIAVAYAIAGGKSTVSGDAEHNMTDGLAGGGMEGATRGENSVPSQGGHDVTISVTDKNSYL